MSQIFFDQLEIPKPDYNLNVSGGSHGFIIGHVSPEAQEIYIYIIYYIFNYFIYNISIIIIIYIFTYLTIKYS